MISNNTSMEKCNPSYEMIKSNENGYNYKETPLYSDKINVEIIGTKYINELNPIHTYYDAFNINIDMLSIKNKIKNTIPSLFINPNCDYYDVLLGVLLISSVEVTQWMPFECEVDHNININIEINCKPL